MFFSVLCLTVRRVQCINTLFIIFCALYISNESFVSFGLTSFLFNFYSNEIEFRNFTRVFTLDYQMKFYLYDYDFVLLPSIHTRTLIEILLSTLYLICFVHFNGHSIKIENIYGYKTCHEFVKPIIVVKHTHIRPSPMTSSGSIRSH